MEKDAALRWSFANVLTKRRYDALREVYGSLEVAYEHLTASLLKQIGCREETVARVLTEAKTFNADAYDAKLRERGILFLTIEDADYPQKLKLIDDPPIFLYCRGHLSILNHPCVALVGTRAMSSYGKRATESFVHGMVQAGVVTVSDLAYGIDAHVAKETVAAGGRTVAVLGHGLGMTYPKAHARLAENIIQKGGLLLSEFPLDLAPDKYTFPARNRIIAGLSMATVILEASQESGSLITADLALDYNRDVFAVPGQIFDKSYSGCHDIIRKGHAQLASSPQDVLAAIGVIVPEHGTKPPSFDSTEEQHVFAALTTMPQSLDDVAVRTALNAATLNATLTILELKGAVKNVGQGRWVRTG